MKLLLSTLFFLAIPLQALPSARDTERDDRGEGFQWRPALLQSGLFLGIQHSFRISTEEQTRANLKGPFFKDYHRSVRGLRSWHDGDPFIVNYVGHSFMGAVTGYIQVHNDPVYRNSEFGSSTLYWRSRTRAFAFSALYSAQFEVGPVSEATLGNVGMRPGTAGAVDLVVTPVGGMAVMVMEDALDRFVVKPIEGRVGNPAVRAVVRGFLNPNRSFANMMRFKKPWYRDTRGGVLDDRQ
ncbi:MAG: hypothetical protein IPM24_13180 [Bryobacterales bacterium]|jgi:hypothetical protein|nr:hypothetical protein [Bryobacterales bacterium]